MSGLDWVLVGVLSSPVWVQIVYHGFGELVHVWRAPSDRWGTRTPMEVSAPTIPAPRGLVIDAEPAEEVHD